MLQVSSASDGSLDSGMSRAFMEEEFVKLGIDPEKNEDEYQRYQMSMFSWSDFAEYWFHDPEDDDAPLHLDPAQRSAINAVQFGYDIDAYPWVIPAARRPKEIIMIWPRQFGKTFSVAVAAACAFVFMQKRYKIGTFSINLEGAQEMMDRIKILIETSAFAYMIESSNLTTITKIGEKVKCVSYPASEGVRGRSLSLGLIDEASRIPNDILSGVILYTLRRKGQRWILLSTPRGYKGDFISHYQIGMKTRPLVCINCKVEYLQESDLMAPYISRFNTYDVPIGLPRCPKCGSVNWIYGVGEYTVIPVDPFNCSWKTREEILHELELAGNTPLARQEILGEIIFEGSNVFTREMLESAVNHGMRNVPVVDKNINNYVAGMDFGKVHDRSVIFIGHYDWNNMIFKWDYMKTCGGAYDEKNYKTIRKDFLNIVLLFNPRWIVPDSTGVGDSIVDEMNEDLKELKANNPWLKSRIYNNKTASPKGMYSKNLNKRKHLGFVFDTKTKMDLIENMVSGFSTRRDIEIPEYAVPESRDFWDECLSFSFEITKDKHIKYGSQKNFDDRVIAYALGYYVGRQSPFVGVKSGNI